MSKIGDKKITFSIESYAGFAWGDDSIWLNPAVDDSSFPGCVIHETLHCLMDRFREEGKLTLSSENEEYVVENAAKVCTTALGTFFCKPKLRKEIKRKIVASRKRLKTKESWG